MGLITGLAKKMNSGINKSGTIRKSDPRKLDGSARYWYGSAYRKGSAGKKW